MNAAKLFHYYYWHQLLDSADSWRIHHFLFDSLDLFLDVAAGHCILWLFHEVDRNLLFTQLAMDNIIIIINQIKNRYWSNTNCY